MKLKTNLIFKYLGVMMLFITLIFCNQIKVKALVDNEKIYGAEDIDGVYVKKVRWYDNFVLEKQASFIRRRSDNHWVYCLQPHVTVKADASYGFTLSDYTEISELTPEQWKEVVLISYYGYGYENHTEDKWYYITQMMIWRVTEPRSEFHFTEGLNGPVNDNLFKSEIDEIQKLVDEHYTKPSFSQNTVTLNKGESIVLTDNNNVLSKYDVSYSGSITAKASGNKLTITANSIGTGTVTLKKVTSKYDTPPVLYYATSSQDVLGVGNYDPIILNYSFNATGGDVSIHKTDDRNNNLAGVKFGVYNSKGQETCTFTTDASGNGSCKAIPLGKYTVKELETVEGYIKNETVFNFELTKSNSSATLNITNEKIRGYIEIQKYDKENNNATPQGDATLKGAVYGIFDSHGTKTGELVTNESGYAKSDLLDYGVYTVKELKASEGYELDTTVYSANINAPKIIVKTTSKEQVIKFDFRLLKVKSDGTSGVIDAEPNARFEIYLKSKNLLMGSITTNDKGQADFTLSYGTYEVCQVDGGSDVGKAPCFDIVIRDKDVERIVNNGLVNVRLKVIKVDQDGNKLTRAGIKFKIKDLSTDNYVCQTLAYPTKETICEYETDADGILITPYPLYAGEYQLEEIDQVVDGYLWNSEPVKFTIEANSNIEFDDELGEIIELNFVNTEVLGSIEIYKIGEEVEIKDGSFTYKEIPLPNVVLGLYDAENNFIEKYTTNENGYVKIKNLKLGKYIIKEIATEDNHVLDEKPYEIELKYKDQYTPIVTETFTLKNYLKKGELDFTKSDLTDGKVIPNVKLSIYTEDDQLIFTGLTDEFGKIKITNLFTGRFYIVEEEAATGYRLSDEKVFFEIKDNGEIVKANMTNDLIIKVRKTLDEETEEKVYIFPLEKPLQVSSEVSDEFVIEPIVKENRSMMIGYVIRNIGENGLLEIPVIEDVDIEEIVLYEGENHISTNYTNSELELMYPKDCELIRTLIGLNSLDGDCDGSCLDDLYFKDCFTEIEDGKINAKFNKLTVKCFDSENQAFSMDCEGNLVVNSITMREQSTTGPTFDEIYPIGSIYLSVNNVDPSTLFGGKWEQIKDVFLLGAGFTYNAGSTGGSATNSHTHTFNHTHNVPGVYHTHNLGDSGYAKLNLASSGSYIYAKMNTDVSFAENYYMRTSGTRTAVSNDTTSGVILLGGSTEATTPGSTITNSQSTSITSSANDNNNMPPYLAVYMWKRTA